MKKPTFTLDREFIKWFFEQPYPELGSNRATVFGYGNANNKENRDYWMQQAFNAGAKAMWNDINETLLDYACAVEGLDPEMLEPSEVYDRARENLHTYVNQQLELFK
jgi:hypothetical protein